MYDNVYKSPRFVLYQRKTMETYIDQIPSFVNAIKSMKAFILANIVLIGQVPAPTFKEKRRSEWFMDRLAGFQVDECTTDGYRNPIGIIRGTSRRKLPIFLIAHLDTHFGLEVDHCFTVKEKTITGPGILDNSAGVGVLVSLPEIFRKLNLTFESDIVLAGVIQSLGKGNLRGLRHLLKTWKGPIRGAVIVEGGELGRLNYYADAMMRCEVKCDIASSEGREHRFKPNAILVLNEIINQILWLRLPQRPSSRVVIGKISGGYKHGVIANEGVLGFEIQSDTDNMVKSIFNDINDIIKGISHEHDVILTLKPISNVHAAKQKFNHPLVKSAVEIMKTLGIEPLSLASESELSILLSHNVPAVTLGITHGDNYHLADATMEIEPMFKGIAQIVGLIKAIDSGVCDG